MQKPIEQIIVDIIKHELNLPDNYGKTQVGNGRYDIVPSVIVYAQNIKLFNTERLQITVKTISSKTYANRNETKEIDGVFCEVQDLNQSRMIQVDIYSRNSEAIERYWEVITSLNSVYAQQQMDKYHFKMGTMTNDVNLSGIEGGSEINRYTVTFNVITHEQKIKQIDYYDKFRTQMYDEIGQFADIKTENY